MESAGSYLDGSDPEDRIPASVPARAGNQFHRALDRRLDALIREFPPGLRADQVNDKERIAFQLDRVYRPGASLADLGAGIGLFCPAAASMGMDVWLVDDFSDEVNERFPVQELEVHARTGVKILETPVREWGTYFDDASLDVVTSFDSLEHWQHSPRAVFAEAMRVLKPGGVLFLGGPNAVNLRKRLGVPLGYSNWSRFEDWYYADEFRGHVREPVLGDLLRILDDLGFALDGVWGRNWAGYVGGRLPVSLMRCIDRALRPFPTLCSDLYVAGRKPETA